MVNKGMEMVPNFFHLSSTDSTTTLSPFSLCLLAHAYHMPFQLVKNISHLDVTVIFLMYMAKLVCTNSDSNQKAIKEQ